MLNSLILLVILSTASAEDFTVLSENQPAPFEGVLLSVPAAAEILAKQEETLGHGAASHRQRHRR